MAKRLLKKIQRPDGYPDHSKVLRGSHYLAQATPEPVYITCCAQLHNPSERQSAAILQVLKINTLAGMWMLRDIAQRKPEQRFAVHRKRNSTRYLTDGIRNDIDKIYRAKIRSRYTININIFGGLCTTVAALVSSYLQKITEARQKGWIKQYEQSAAYVVKTGRHAGKSLGSLGRKTIYGYAFLAPKAEQCEDALRALNILLSHEQDNEQLWIWAKQYRMTFGPRRNHQLGSMRQETLRRLKLLVERDLQRADELDELRKVAQTYLRFTPPGFPTFRSDGLSPKRQSILEQKYIDALEEFAALPDIEHDDLLLPNLTAEEYVLFRDLQHHAYTATSEPVYIPLRWNRADGCIRSRECALVYDPAKKQYLFLVYLLADGSRHKRILKVHGDLYDVNNPKVSLSHRTRPSTAMMFELEFDSHQQKILDQARQNSVRWKDTPKSTAGSIRAATFHAYFSEKKRTWWFEVHLSVGLKPTHIDQPEHVVGVHIDPVKGWYATVLGLDGVQRAQFQLDEYTIAILLDNKDPVQQASIKPSQRTAKERQHRIADALVAICRQYCALLGVENIAYRRSDPASADVVRNDSSRTIVGLLSYKLAQVNLPDVVDIRGVAPKRDCGRCGTRHPESQVLIGQFSCPTCGYMIERYANTSYEVARRLLWVLARKNRPQKKQSR